jgi:hypothetical protein
VGVDRDRALRREIGYISGLIGKMTPTQKLFGTFGALLNQPTQLLSIVCLGYLVAIASHSPEENIFGS